MVYIRKNLSGSIVQISNTPIKAINYDRDLFENKLHNKSFPNLTILNSNAEQEYILQNMVKGAIQETYEIAKNFNISIVTRPTSFVAFMNNEAGYPTKPEEIKNKTCKIEDTFLHQKITRNDIGAVVHYKPFKQNIRTYSEFKRNENAIWNCTYNSIKNFTLENYQTDSNKIKTQFELRTKEYFEEDPHYRFGGKFRKTVMIDEPFLYLRKEPGIKIYGDHDLFCFADSSGKYPCATQNSMILLQLRYSDRFQAQHGAIYYWNPTSSFDISIKNKIISSHDVAYGTDPLIVTTPHYVQLSFFDAKKNCLISVWEALNNTKWLSTTYSGKKLLSIHNLNIHNRK